MMQQTRTYVIGAIALAAIIGLIWWGVTRQQNTEPQGSIKIGVIAPLTGVGSYQAQQAMRGLELARDKINKQGGVNDQNVELIVEDSKAEPATATTALNKLINVDAVKFVIGDVWVSTTVVIVPIANERRVFLLSPIATLNSLSKEDLFFRTMPTTKDMMEPLASYAYNTMGVRRVGILRQATPFGVEHANDFREAFQKLGGQIVAEESFDLTASDVRTEISKVKAQNPDAIFNLHATSPRLGLLMKQAKELGLTNVKWLGSFGSENGTLVKEYGSVVNGLTYPYSYDPADKGKGVQTFVAAYQVKHTDLPDLAAANSYDALSLLVEAIDEVGEDPQKVKEYFLGLKDYDGASGVITFDQNGDVKKPIFIKEIREGQFVRLSK